MNHGRPRDRRLTKGQIWFLMIVITVIALTVIGTVGNATSRTCN